MTINDVKLLNLRTFIEPDGNLVPVESKHDIPFDIKRIFYVYGVQNQDDRGKHSHYKTKQVLICLSGEVEVINFDVEPLDIYFAGGVLVHNKGADSEPG